jgi:hypothetical protein
MEEETMSLGPELSRPNGISYLHLPATDPTAAARFYQAAFSWAVHDLEGPRPGFEDGTGHVAGAWVTDQAVQREPGLLLYIYVDDARRAGSSKRAGRWWRDHDPRERCAWRPSGIPPATCSASGRRPLCSVCCPEAGLRACEAGRGEVI